MKKTLRINILLILFIACMFLAPKAMASTYSVSSDNIIDSGQASEYQKCSTYGDIGSWSSYGGHSFRYLAKINLNGLSSTQQFDKAVFKIDRVSTSWDDDDNYVLYKVTSNWDENSVTWNYQPTYSSTGVRAQVVSQGVYRYEFDVTNIVKEWLSNPSTNYGFIIKKEVENTSLASHKGLFACADYSTSGSEGIPVLEISSGVGVQSSSNNSSSSTATSSSSSSSSSNSADIVANLSGLPKADVYKAIAKVMTIGVNQDYGLMEIGYGSGVIISSDGLLLTNSHVITVDDNYDETDEAAGYNICLNTAIDKEPDCSYKGKLIAKDEKMDIALLKIEKVPGLSGLTVFPYINFAAIAPDVNDELVALGFPSIGGDTITVTKGIVSGKLTKYSQDWLKTDAVISFGSSGGAAINMDGELVGITSSGYSDLLGEMGYVINLKSLNSWIDTNKTKNAPTESALMAKLNNFIVKKEQVDLNSTFTIDTPNISITKPNDWNFSYGMEGGVSLTKNDDDIGGSISIDSTKYPFAVSAPSSGHVLSQLYDLGIIGMADIISNTATTINGQPARDVVVSLQGMNINFYLVSRGQYLVTIFYDYGKDDQDKALVDNAIKSISFDSAPAAEAALYKYKNTTHDFSLNTSGSWVIMPKYIGNQPVSIYNKGNNTSVSVTVNKETEDQKKISDDIILGQLKTAVASLNTLGETTGTKINIVKSSVKNKINSQLNNIILIESVFQKTSTGESIVHDLSYTMRKNGKIYSFELMTFGLSDNDYAKAVTEFNSMLNGFSWGLSGAAVSSTNSASQTAKATSNTASTAKEDTKLAKRLSGKILLAVEDGGKAWYVNPSSLTKFYLADGNAAYSALKKFGIGITNANLNKIPVGIEDRVLGTDSDNDGLDDKTEVALGTDINKADTDGDGYKDGEEVKSGYNPKGAGKSNTNSTYAKSLEGKIFLQVEGNGEAWYVYNGKRYYLADGDAAYKIMKFLSLGITNSDLSQIETGN